MRFLIIFSILSALVSGCSSFERDSSRQEQQQAVDTFDSPVGNGVYADPYGHQPR